MVQRVKVDREESEYKWMGEWEVPAQLQHLSKEKLLNLARRFKPCQFKKGEMVLREGDPGRSMFFVNSGSVAVTVNDVVVDSFHTRDFFGEVGMLLGERRSANISARSLTELLQLDVDDFFEASREAPEVARAIADALAAEASASDRLGQALNILRKLADVHMKPDRGHRRVTSTGLGLDAARRWLPVGSRLREQVTIPTTTETEGTPLNDVPLNDLHNLLQDPVSFARNRACLDYTAVAALEALECLHDLPKFAIAEILMRCKQESVRGHTTILEATQRVDKIYVVSQGSVRVLRAGGHGLSAHIITPGHAFGLVGCTLPARGVSVMQAVTVEDAQLLVIHRQKKRRKNAVTQKCSTTNMAVVPYL
jgi:CRP-like cAMP-binding protein